MDMATINNLQQEIVRLIEENEVLRLDKMVLEMQLEIATKALERYSNSRYWSSNNIYDTPEEWGHFEACDALEKLDMVEKKYKGNK